MLLGRYMQITKLCDMQLEIELSITEFNESIARGMPTG